MKKILDFSILNVTLLPILFIVCFILLSVKPVIGKQSQKDLKVIENVCQDSTEFFIDSINNIRQELIEETKTYILKTVPKAHSNIDIIVPHLVDHSLGNNIDLCFVLAQCKIETLFGTAGMGRSQSKKSMFGINKKYKTYEECIIHYISNLKRNYLSKNRNIHHLMKNFITHNGHRYAADPKYEPKLKKQYNEIKRKTNIDNLEQEYRKLNSCTYLSYE